MVEKEKFIFSWQNLSHFWHVLNHSHNSDETAQANLYINEFKNNCSNYLEISMNLFSSQYIEDKYLSSILIHQYIKSHPSILLNDKKIFDAIDDFVRNKVLIPYTQANDNQQIDNNTEKINDLIVKRNCYIMSLLVLIGSTGGNWTNAINDMIFFGGQSIKHTYLMIIIFGNCYDELNTSNIFTSQQEQNIKSYFIQAKGSFLKIINDIIINYDNNKDKELYKKTLDLAKNLTHFELNILLNPNLVKKILSNLNSNISQTESDLFCESLNNSKNKKLDNELTESEINIYLEKLDPKEIESIGLIIDKIGSDLNNNSNLLNDEIIFRYGQIFSSITENFVVLFFKKDSVSKKMFFLFSYFISKKKNISQLFFETLKIMTDFITINYKLSNFDKNEKIEFLNYLIKIMNNVKNNCTYKSISNDKNMDDFDDEDISIDDYRINAEEVFCNIFIIFEKISGDDGIKHLFINITQDMINILKKNINEVNENNLLSIEVVIYAIKCLIDNFEEENIDKTPLNNFTLVLINSQIMSNNFILYKFLSFIEQSSSIFSYDINFFTKLLSFLCYHLEIMINSENAQDMQKLISSSLFSICDSANGLFDVEIWKKLFQIYINFYDKLSPDVIYNVVKSLCSLLIIEEDENDDDENNINISNNNIFPSEEEISEYNKKLIEIPVIRICQLGNFIKDSISTIKGNKDKESQLKLNVIKNFHILEIILGQSSQSTNKKLLNQLFNIIYNQIVDYLTVILNFYNKENDNEVINSIMGIFIKCSNHFDYEILEKIFTNLTQLLIDFFFSNDKNYRCIHVLKNMYELKLKNLNDKNETNQNYVDIYNNFMKINRKICIFIFNNSSYSMELLEYLSIFFIAIFPHLNIINKNEHLIISDTIKLFIQGIKMIYNNAIINNIFSAIIKFLNSPNPELISNNFDEIVQNSLSFFIRVNENTLKNFSLFFIACISINKTKFLSEFGKLLTYSEFNYLDNKQKLIILKYLECFSTCKERIAKIIFSVLNIINKNIVNSVDKIFEQYEKEITNNNENMLKN